MNMKKIKKFFTLARQRDGFTLVELIVVIAILAILGGVAVPAYGGYVKKANMTADQSLVAEVADALTLYYYSHPGTQGGYVILSTDGIRFEDGVSVDESVGASAMAAVFGDAAVNLKYEDWTNDGMLNEVKRLQDSGKLDMVANSTYLKDGTTEGLTNTVTNLLKTAASMIAGNDGDVISKLGKYEQYKYLADTVKDVDKDKQGTAAANLLVGHFADVIYDGSSPDDPMVILANKYASAYAFSVAEGGDPAYLAALDEQIASAQNYNDLCALADGNWEAELDGDLMDSYDAFMSNNSDNDAALKELMGAVGAIADSHTSVDEISNSDLYSSDAVVDQVNGYKSAVAAAQNMTIPNLGDGEVIVFLFADGSVYTSINVGA